MNPRIFGKALILGLVIGILVGAVPAYIMAQTNSKTRITETGIYAPSLNASQYWLLSTNITDILAYPEQTASYIIFGRDTNGDGVYDVIYAKNCSSGEIEFSGTDAATVIQQAIDALPNSGGRIFIKAGEYIISSAIQINKNYITIEGESPINTCLKLADGANCNLIEFTANWGLIRIRHLELDGNKANNVAGSGIYHGGYNGIYEDLVIHDFKEHGIEILETGGTNNRFIMVESYNNDKSGFYVRKGDQRYLLCRAFSNGEYGMQLYGSVQYVIEPFVFGNGLSGIYVTGGAVRILGGNIATNNRHGIHLNATEAGINIFEIRGVLIRENSKESANTYDAIHLEGDGPPWISVGIISENIIDGSTDHRHGIYIHNIGVRRVLISDNDVRFASVSEPIYVAGGTDIMIRRNPGYLTENSGTATLLNGTTSIAFTHGLASTPTVVTANPTTDLGSASYWWVTYNSTHITIHVNADPGKDVTFNWRAEVN
ncbi:MAG: hypothetical protein DRI26_10025 [Chloroflexi bacterium]|nr:MAG: hypothetical protein DRI26_10025 [Chloroflexota bacterium]